MHHLTISLKTRTYLFPHSNSFVHADLHQVSIQNSDGKYTKQLNHVSVCQYTNEKDSNGSLSLSDNAQKA